MKKRYILLPAAAVAVLTLAIVIAVVLINGKYLKKLKYDHVEEISYNNVQIVGENGLFYLSSDGKKVTEGYASLKSVNDFYSDLSAQVEEKTDVVFFDYYLARRPDSEGLYLVNSNGEEYLIDGDTYTIDKENTSLPYLVFSNNQNGMKSAISLYRLDSDVSYQSGKTLTLRPFKSVDAQTFRQNGVLCTYLVTLDNSEQQKYSYFGQDGIKITTGTDIEVIPLYDSKNETSNTYFYNRDEKYIISYAKATVATKVKELRRADASDWRYAICESGDNGAECIITISPDKLMTFAQDNYSIDSAWDFGDCLIIKSSGDGKQNVINTINGRSASYKSVLPNGILLTAEADDASYVYINSQGLAVTKSQNADMIPISALSDNSCYVLTSVTAGNNYIYFARVGADTYTFDRTGISIDKLNCDGISAYMLSKETLYEQDGIPQSKQQYAVLSPFSAIKISEYYDSLENISYGYTEWLWAHNDEKGSFDVIDPLTAKPVFGFKTAQGGAESYGIDIESTLSLPNAHLTSDFSTDITVVSVRVLYEDMQKSNTRYFALYRPNGKESSTSPLSLQSHELGYALNAALPCTVMGNYIAAYTASGTDIYALDDANTLEYKGHIPYRAVNIIKDTVTDEEYIKVSSDSGKFGLYTTSCEVLLAPYYNSVDAPQNGCFIVNMRGAYGVIRPTSSDIKRIIDFEYISIEPLGNDGYLAVEGDGTATVWFDKNSVLRTSVQNLEYIRNYTVNADGVLCCDETALFSAGGKLYTVKK